MAKPSMRETKAMRIKAAAPASAGIDLAQAGVLQACAYPRRGPAGTAA